MAQLGSRQSGFFGGSTSGGSGGGGVPYTGATQNVDLGDFGLKSEYIELNQTTPYTPAVARMGWNPTQGTYDLTFADGTVNNIGQQLDYPPCVNKTLVSLPFGCCVMADPLNPIQGNDVCVTRMISNGTYPAKLFLGLLTNDIAPDGIGHVCWFGDLLNIDINDINLNSETWAEGDILYPDPAHDGGLTKTQPIAPNIDVAVCLIKKISGSNIDVLVRPIIAPDVNELNDVYAPSPTNEQGLFWSTANSRYENASVETILGQASASNNGYLASTDWTRFANFQILSGYQTLGSAFKSILMSNPSISNITQGIPLNTGSLRLVAVYVPIAQTITGVKWFQSTQGAFTSSGYNGVALFTYSAGTLTRVTLSFDTETTWETALINTWGSVAFSVPYSASEGLYYVGILFNGSGTTPAIYGTVNSVNANVNIGDFNDSAKLNLTLGSQTTMPTSVSMSGAGVAVSANNPAVYLY